MKERQRMRPRLTYANVVATLALFIAVGGASAFAASQLGKNSVGTRQLRKSAVTAAKIKKNAVDSTKIADGAVSGAKVLDGSLTGTDIQDGSLTAADIDQASLARLQVGNVTAMSFMDDGSCSPSLPLPSGVTSSRSFEGICLITFPNEVSGCAVNATIHFRPTKLTLMEEKDRTAQVFTTPNKSNQLIVQTFEEDGLIDLPFDLVLVC